MKKILVTGTLGFIGSNFIRHVTEKYPDISWVGIDKMAYNYCSYNMHKSHNYNFYLADISHESMMNNIFKLERPDTVINFAAESFVCSSIENPNPFITSNIMGTQTLINNSIKYEVEKFLLISTDEVYGSHQSKTSRPWTETCVTHPRNPYSASKLGAENILYAANQTHGLKFNISRCCNVFGGRQPTDRNLIPKCIKHIRKEIPIPIYGDGSHIREYIHVDDKISALLTILEKGKNNEIYNIGSGYELSNIEVTQSIAKTLDQKAQIEHAPDRKGHDFRYALDFSKIKKLGWKPQLSWEEGLGKCVNWYLSNPEWFEIKSLSK